ncbi:MAG TPA: FliA/WhiG family RNA polymerase sigma factor [Oceanospirillaceae bacterium]|nr:FliA/WhiG family RNA polymerase sigma factor [Oceanospirillaceae bacterium]
MHNLSLYHANNEKVGADPLIEYMPLVKQVAMHLSARLPASVDVDDLIQVGMMGLLEAMQNYDASKGAQFETFAKLRVRGAMLDEMRRFSTLPRSVMTSIRDINLANGALEQALGRPAKDAELAEHMGLSLAELQDQKGRNYNYQTVHVEDQPEGVEPALSALMPSKQVDEAAFQQALANAIGELPEREQLIFALYYDEELNLKEIAAVLEVSESRVCQIQGASVKKLRQKLVDWI